MVSDKDRARMRRIGAAMTELNRQAIEDAARRSPGENIEIGLRLGDAALAFVKDGSDRPLETLPIYRWRHLKALRRDEHA